MTSHIYDHNTIAIL